MSRYGHQSTSYNGVFNHVFNSYPKAKAILGFYDKIPIEQRHCRYNPKGLNQFMIDYRTSRNNKPSKCPHKNSKYIQQDFQSFIKYCQEHLK